MISSIAPVSALLLATSFHENEKLRNSGCEYITAIYGFQAECLQKYGNQRVWQMFTDVFDYLPIAAIIDNKVFAVHGGLSPTIHQISDIKQI